MELRQLKYFLSVADERSFVSAANSLYISRQAVSKAIAQLEEELNVELFMRDSSGAFLTPAGIMFYDRVRSIVMELDEIRARMQAYGTRYHQRIRLAFSIGTVGLLEEDILQYRKLQNNAEIVYTECPESDCQKLLLDQQAELAISTTHIHDPLFVSEEILHCRFGIYLHNAQPEELSEIDMKDLSWIPLAGAKDAYVTKFCEQHNINLQYNGFDYQRLFDLAHQGKCALLLPECLIPANLPDMQWLPLPKADPWKLYKTYPKSLEKNLLFSSALDDLHSNVFIPLSERNFTYAVSAEMAVQK